MAVSLLIEHSISISIMVVTLGWRNAAALGRTNSVALSRAVTHCTFISGFGCTERRDWEASDRGDTSCLQNVPSYFYKQQL